MELNLVLKSISFAEEILAFGLLVVLGSLVPLHKARVCQSTVVENGCLLRTVRLIFNLLHGDIVVCDGLFILPEVLIALAALH